MYVVLKESATSEEILELKKFIQKTGHGALEILDGSIKKIGIMGKKDGLTKEELKEFSIVKEIIKIGKPFKFVSREFKKEDTLIEIKGRKIGGTDLILMAGPCSIENKEMIMDIAKVVKENGGEFLRGGAFKPRTSPYDFQGLGEEGLKYMREACDKYDLVMVTEVMDTRDIELIEKYTDIFQVGARNMQNFSLLKELGKTNKPILLKRGLSATIREFLMAAEYIVAFGNEKVILCERGIRTFEIATRNTVDINGVALLKEKSHLPIIIDASHGTGKKSLVEPVTLGCILAGADGAMVEIHQNPACALSDGEQSLNFQEFEILCKKMKKTLEFKESLKCL
ncbi:MAG: 3-deoxy-7-phosphoheptulonate synthase [Cetobacterium somerae]|mgnify:CR=1 FL=1|uniref:3-deoxy-7-phosphoheptulonate synthase n=1 Tax=Cetobacterium TaxID=180162 RepID=UPI00163BEB52|nr:MULTISPECIES: 3-deoxy-7-phosphoheptulonate synthase [Cetobacterium]MBC2852975.1 3-deoxy-7-phosphoheptulonate synthase [Cetobacterium sp. 2G large]MCQ8211657.1 3-deoxy-7-phosphoheptulonate synthase [Cetobacterium sp. NK01]MCQ9627023.1 3-deoxy-7-phosphoheptulonate synthase [Cetobacterium somerae]